MPFDPLSPTLASTSSPPSLSSSPSSSSSPPSPSSPLLGEDEPKFYGPTRGDKSTFHTLSRERRFRHPPAAPSTVNGSGEGEASQLSQSDVPALDELVRPHIESFDALVQDPRGGKGLLMMGVDDIGEKVVFDGVAREGAPFGTKITCECGRSVALHMAVSSSPDGVGWSGRWCQCAGLKWPGFQGVGRRLSERERRDVSELGPLSLPEPLPVRHAGATASAQSTHRMAWHRRIPLTGE